MFDEGHCFARDECYLFMRADYDKMHKIKFLLIVYSCLQSRDVDKTQENTLREFENVSLLCTSEKCQVLLIEGSWEA